MEEVIDQEYINNFYNLEKQYNKFYNQEIKEIKILYLYINNDNEIYNIKSESEKIENNCLTKERILYLIKKNQFNMFNKHKLVSLLKYNINLEHTQLKNFILDKSDNKNDFLISLKIIDNIYFKNSISIFNNLNSVIFLFTNKTQEKSNTTKRINIKLNNSKTRRNKSNEIFYY
tara:strand:- start:270 stop:791 length:522 start_codon:yes stop_codon:yes gene_type:complete